MRVQYAAFMFDGGGAGRPRQQAHRACAERVELPPFRASNGNRRLEPRGSAEQGRSFHARTTHARSMARSIHGARIALRGKGLGDRACRASNGHTRRRAPPPAGRAAAGPRGAGGVRWCAAVGRCAAGGAACQALASAQGMRGSVAEPPQAQPPPRANKPPGQPPGAERTPHTRSGTPTRPPSHPVRAAPPPRARQAPDRARTPRARRPP